MKDKIKSFFDLYLIDNKGDLGIIKDIILNDKNYYYNSSNDFQIFDLSYEYNYKNNKISDDIRFSYFGSSLNFLDLLFLKGIIKSKEPYIKEYLRYKNILKDKLLTYSFILSNNKLKSIKLYFDVDISKKSKLTNLEKKLNEKIVLVSFSFSDDIFIEEKFYYELNSYVYYYSSLYLKNNIFFDNYRKNNPFEVLFRKDGKGKLISIKYYYKDNTKNNKLFNSTRELFNSTREKNNKFNIKNEIGIDFNFKGGINKIDYYIGLYK